MQVSNGATFKLLRMIRVHIVVGGVLAFSLGALLAVVEGGTLSFASAVLAYLVVFLGDLSTHFSNDYYDVEVDKYRDEKKLFAGSAILVSNPNLRPKAKFVFLGLMLASNILAAAMVLLGMAPLELLIIMLCANVAGWVYSAPPLRLISRGLGEVVVACVTGFVIPAVGYLSVRGQLDAVFLYLAVPFIMYGLILSLSLEAPDGEIDRIGGKNNLVVRKGLRTVFVLILAMAALATVAFGLYAWQVPAEVNLGLVGLFSLVPFAVCALGFVRFSQKKSVNRLSALNIFSLFFFNVAMVFYLLAAALVL